MVDVGERAAKHLSQLTECSICLSVFTDPRMLPCIHTFCLQCLKRTAETAETEKKPGDEIPCPLCRKEFIIPPDGMTGLQKNFFMEDLLDLNAALQATGGVAIICDKCNFRNKGKAEQIPTAVMRCTVCLENYCDSCVRDHQLQILNGKHKMINIGSEITSEIQRVTSVKSCTEHTQKPLDYYCADCKKIVCVSCFVESHKSHDCKDVTTVDEKFRRAIQRKAWLMSNYADELISMRETTEKRVVNFLKEIVECEYAIYERNQEFEDLLASDSDKKSLLNDLSVIKSNHFKQIESDMEEIDRSCTILKSFEAYCTELRLKGSAIDICSLVDELIDRADDLERDHEAIIGSPRQSVEVSFQTADFLEESQMHYCNNNVLGEIHVKEITSLCENYAVIVGLNYGTTITNDVIKINLHRPNEISTQEQLPITTQIETAAAVYCNTMYITGVGDDADEIWKYSFVSGWMKCASLVQGRLRHSAAFIDEVLYICGGFVESTQCVLDSVEAYNVITDECTAVGKLVHSVESSGNCVPFNSSLYIFGGTDKDKRMLSCVQVYHTKTNTCSVLSKPMPRPYTMMRAVLWETSVILIRWNTCFIFNFQTETWKRRKQFKAGVVHFGLLLENENFFVIGGGIDEKDEAGKRTWTYRDDVRYVPLQNIIDNKPIEWKIHGKLPKPTLVHAYAKLRGFN